MTKDFIMMMTVESLYDWLTEKRTEVAQEKEYFNLQLLVIPHFICDDGTSISIQASHFHYCDKKQELKDGDDDSSTVVDAHVYATFEISMLADDCKTDKLKQIYNERNFHDSVIGHVPIDWIVAEINAHQNV